MANEFMPILAAKMAQHAGNSIPRILWYTTYQSTNEAAIRKTRSTI